VKNIIPDIIFSNFKESTYSQSNNNIFLAVNQNNNQKGRNHTSNIKRKRIQQTEDETTVENGDTTFMNV